MSEYQNLNNILNKLGIPNYEFLGEKGVPIDTLVNSKMSSKPYVDILLKFLPKLVGNEQEMIVRALSEKGNKKATQPLIQMFNTPNKYSEILLWTIGNALSKIDNKEFYPQIIELCKNKKLGNSRQILFLEALPKIASDDAFQVLLDGLNDKNVRGHALEGLGKLGNLEAIQIIEKMDVQKGKYEFKAKEIALRKLRKKNSRQ